MGILNATPDSFHAASRVDAESALRPAERMLEEGATILDVGGASSRPGSEEIELEEELRRVIPVVEALHARFPEVLLSIDTWRSTVAERAVDAGAGMVNDIGAGLLDGSMLRTVARLGVPYVLMHMQGTPSTMQVDPRYTDVVAEVVRFLSERKRAAHAEGIADIVLDPGFGFGKTTAYNFALLRGMERTTALGAPVLVGLSRKRMINEVLGTTSKDALNGSTTLQTVALLKGASIIRTHDVLEAAQAIKLLAQLDPQ